MSLTEAVGSSPRLPAARCPSQVCDKNAGSALLRQPRRIEQILRATSAALGDTPLTFKTRKGFNDGEDVSGERRAASGVQHV